MIKSQYWGIFYAQHKKLRQFPALSARQARILPRNIKKMIKFFLDRNNF